MKIPERFRTALDRRFVKMTVHRVPDQVIGDPKDPYLERWYIIPRNRWCNVYFHLFCRSDDDRALHDHPWVNLSVLLHGVYLEITPGRETVREAGEIVLRGARRAHRIALLNGKARTLFITGPRVRTWGFHCPHGWRDWRLFTNPATGGNTIGRGCDD